MRTLEQREKLLQEIEADFSDKRLKIIAEQAKRRNKKFFLNVLYRANVKQIKRLLDAEILELEYRTKEKFTPLIYFSIYNQVDKIKLLLDYGADINARDKYRRTPLIVSTEVYSPETTKLLLEYGARITDAGMFQSVLGNALDDHKVMLQIEPHITTVNIRDDNGDTFLHHSIFHGLHHAIGFIRQGAKLLKDNDKQDPLDLAIKLNNYDAVLIFKHYYDIDPNKYIKAHPNMRDDIKKLLLK